VRSLYDILEKVWSPLKRLSPDDHAKMVLFPLLVTVGAINLFIGESLGDILVTSGASFLIAGIIGYQAYTAWNAAQGDTEGASNE
jgi:membrane associated rhomboid family serine protease